MKLEKFYKTSFFHRITTRMFSVVQRLYIVLGQSFVYKQLNVVRRTIPDIKLSYIGWFVLIVTLVHTKFLYNRFLGNTIDFRIFFYVFIATSILFLTTPLKLGEVFKSSLIKKLWRY